MNQNIILESIGFSNVSEMRNLHGIKKYSGDFDGSTHVGINLIKEEVENSDKLDIKIVFKVISDYVVKKETNEKEV